MKKIYLLISLGILISIISKAQSSECLSDFNYLIEKIENDYPGYTDKTKNGKRSKLIQLEQDLKQRIKQYPDSCGKYLKKYASWFQDHHLRVNYIRQSNTAQNNKNSLQKNIQYYNVKPDGICKTNKTIEGIWVGHRGKMAIVEKGDGKYVGVAIQYPNYDKNQIMFEFSEVNIGEFETTSFYPYHDYLPKKKKASLHIENNVLEIHDDTRFVRQTDDNVSDKAFLYSYIAEYPNGRNTYPIATYLSDSTYYIRLPGFNSDRADVFVTQHWEEIMSRPNLILDIRNNGGGQDVYYQILAKMIYTNPYLSKGVEWYASKGNIKIFEDALKNGTLKNGNKGIDWANSLLKEMKKNIGGFVVHPMMGEDVNIVRDTVYPFPKRVGIIINEGNASSAEQFLLTAQHSKKVILFGDNNTAGVLDYSNAVSELFPSGKFELTFPMTRSRRLPENPIDNIGISPDVIIPFPPTEQLYGRFDDWCYFVKNYLEFINEMENTKR